MATKAKSKSCAVYKSENREAKNRVRKIRRHLREQRHSNDVQGRNMFLKLGGKEVDLR
jgi:hypothetical protein